MQKSSNLQSDRSGSSAIEFAILAPVFLLTLFSILAYGIYLGTAHSVQQLASDAARASIAGMNPDERQALASSYIKSSTVDDFLLDPEKLSVVVKTAADDSTQFTVTLAYDASGLPIWSLYSFAMPDSTITRYSTIRVGGI